MKEQSSPTREICRNGTLMLLMRYTKKAFKNNKRVQANFGPLYTKYQQVTLYSAI